jgi:hypothetical protein
LNCPWQCGLIRPGACKLAWKPPAASITRYGFAEYALHDYAKGARTSWIADHIDATMAQTLASRAYQAVNRVCLGRAKQVRFRSRGRGMGSVEGKRNDTGMRFVLQQAEEGNAGCLVWGQDRILALIDWNDALVTYGLRLDIGKKRRLQRKMQRQRRANNPHNYDERGRVKRHGKLVNDLVRMGHHMRIEQTCFKGWQKRYGKSIALRAPGLSVAHLTRAVAKTGRVGRKVRSRTDKS